MTQLLALGGRPLGDMDFSSVDTGHRPGTLKVSTLRALRNAMVKATI
jgi:hypothetical protein